MQPSDIRKLMAGKRFEPTTPQQWRQAKDGASAMDADWEAKALPAFVGNGMRGANRYYRAAYELRYHELLALYPIS